MTSIAHDCGRKYHLRMWEPAPLFAVLGHSEHCRAGPTFCHHPCGEGVSHHDYSGFDICRTNPGGRPTLAAPPHLAAINSVHQKWGYRQQRGWGNMATDLIIGTDGVFCAGEQPSPILGLICLCDCSSSSSPSAMIMRGIVEEMQPLRLISFIHRRADILFWLLITV